MNAYEELLAALEPGEEVRGIVFGNWGGTGYPAEKLAYCEPPDRPVPVDARGRVLSLEEARPYMVGWSFDGGHGTAECYATWVWTDRRVIWVHEYDGSTHLSWMPRHPIECTPELS